MLAEIESKPLKLNFKKIMGYSKYSKVTINLIKLKKYAVAFIASQMPSKSIEKLGTIFKQIDTNHDGFITIA